MNNRVETNWSEIARHIFLDAQAAVAGGVIGAGIATHDYFAASVGMVIGAFGAQTIHVIEGLNTQGKIFDASEIRHKEKK